MFSLLAHDLPLFGTGAPRCRPRRNTSSMHLRHEPSLPALACVRGVHSFRKVPVRACAEQAVVRGSDGHKHDHRLRSECTPADGPADA
jgi:hypothetical protein